MNNNNNSRIARYQISIKKCMENKSFNLFLENELIKDIDFAKELLDEEADYLIPITLLTILSERNRKNAQSNHGYYMGCGIELLLIASKIQDKLNYYNNKYDSNKLKILKENFCLFISNALLQNIEHLKKTMSKNKLTDISKKLVTYINDRLLYIIKPEMPELKESIKKTDLVYFNNNIKKQITNLKTITKESYDEYFKNKYQYVCQISVVSAWLFGYGDMKNIQELEKIANNLAHIYKIANDFKNLSFDLENHNNYTFNYVINFGIQNAFESFIQNKAELIERCVKLNLYSHTMKEVIDVIEKNVDNLINNCDIKLASHYTLSKTSKTSSKV
jgi:geranylgeranyl pyrophosphate synthase